MSDESESVVSAAKPSPRPASFREGMLYQMQITMTTARLLVGFVESRFTSCLCLECDRPLLPEEQARDMLCEHCARSGRS